MSLAFTSFTFDQPEYNPGQTITLSVVYTTTDLAAATTVTSAVTAVLTDATSGSVSQASDGSASFPNFVVSNPSGSPEPVDVTVTDDRTTPGTWTLVSNTVAGTAAPFTGTAVLTSTA